MRWLGRFKESLLYLYLLSERVEGEMLGKSLLDLRTNDTFCVVSL